ncbi:SRPBCC family protein [Nonomuraea sp. NPDC001636]|uniref:SRPBCC family protein n=1 Tax=Nonomuraea sp. NPDC001636 TaxID=3154391 RepID=UPI003322B698
MVSGPCAHSVPRSVQLPRSDERAGTPVKQISASIDIQAAPERVWDVLVDFAGYEAWNPFIQQGSGQAVVGSTLTLRMHPQNGKP